MELLSWSPGSVSRLGAELPFGEVEHFGKLFAGEKTDDISIMWFMYFVDYAIILESEGQKDERSQ
jgi:hypothetical protein